ncbi:MAG: hypothetical protein ACT6FF_07360 [Methanosarcinaceae archaeon]
MSSTTPVGRTEDIRIDAHSCHFIMFYYMLSKLYINSKSEEKEDGLGLKIEKEVRKILQTVIGLSIFFPNDV